MSDPYELQRFIEAQNPIWHSVCAELSAGCKRTHWMWFVFPQLADLGQSANAKFYGLDGLTDARAYAVHPLLGARLREACRLLLQAPAGLTSIEILGSPDHLKLRSSMTLFAAAVPDEPTFLEVLARFDDGQQDPLTIEALR